MIIIPEPQKNLLRICRWDVPAPVTVAPWEPADLPRSTNTDNCTNARFKYPVVTNRIKLRSRYSGDTLNAVVATGGCYANIWMTRLFCASPPVL